MFCSGGFSTVSLQAFFLGGVAVEKCQLLSMCYVNFEKGNLSFGSPPVEVTPQTQNFWRKASIKKNTFPPRREEFEPQLWWVLKTFPFPAGHCKRSLLITGPSAPRPPYPPTNESVLFFISVISLKKICGEFFGAEIKVSGAPNCSFETTVFFLNIHAIALRIIKARIPMNHGNCFFFLTWNLVNRGWNKTRVDGFLSGFSLGFLFKHFWLSRHA